MAERKAVIKNADMSEDMQQDAVDCASQALEKYNIEKVFVYLHINLKWIHFLFHRILPRTLKRSLTRNITPRGTASLGETLGLT